MFQLKHILNEFLSVVLYEDLLFYWDKSGALTCANIASLKIRWQVKTLRNIAKSTSGFFDESYYFLPIYRGMFRVALESGEVSKLENCNFETSSGRNDAFKRIAFDHRESSYKLYDVKEDKVVWEISSRDIPMVIFYNTRKHLIFYKKLIITSLSITNGSLLWQVDLSKLIHEPSRYHSAGVIMETDNKLFLSVNYTSYFVLDTSTGKLLKIISKLPEGKTWLKNNRQEMDIIPYSGHSSYDSARNCIIGMAMGYYWEVDLSSYQVSFWDLTEELAADQIYIDSKGILDSNGKAYFISNFKDRQANITITKLVCFDPVKRKVIDTYEFDREKYPEILKSTLAIEGKWLRVSERGNTTFVFKLEEELNQA